jgi:Flp pilus assembly protein TadG
MPKPTLRRSRPRRGAVTLEMILALPLLLIASLAIFQFGVLQIIQQTTTTAAVEGARAAAREGDASDAREAAVEAVNDVLAVHGLAVSPGSGLAPSGGGVRLAVEYPQGGSVLLAEAGDSDVACETPASPTLTGNEVRVTVCVDLTKQPLLNLLATFGFDVLGKRLQTSAMAAKE